jgi:ketosteroid isomerase-like protein
MPRNLINSSKLWLKLDEAYNKNDAPAVAALFTKDASLVASDGIYSGRGDIEKRYAETFQRSHIIDFDSRREHHESTTRFGRTGGGAVLFESQSGTAFASGYWSAIYVREGNVWKIRMLSIIERPATTFEKK